MSSHSTTNRLAAAFTYCDVLEKTRQQKSVLEQELRELREQVKSKPRKRVRTEQDYVYIIKASNGYYKIGISYDPHVRFKDLQREAAIWAVDLELVHTIASKNAYALEQSLHGRFREQRVTGEWFLLTAQDIEWLQSY